jgi:hypothetical protein
MKDQVADIKGLMAGLQAMSAQIVDYLPRVLLALIVLIIGWLVARLMRYLVIKAIARLDQVWQRVIHKRGFEPINTEHRQQPTRIIGMLTFWLLLLIFVTLAAEILGLNVFSLWLVQIFAYLPLAAAGIFIVLIGYVISSLARDLMLSAALSAGLAHGDLLARTTQIMILFIAIVLGIDQIGIDIMFVTVIAGIILATLLGGIAIAFGLGSRVHVSNIIAANEIKNIYRIGDKIRINETVGKIIDITVSQIVVETEEGISSIPAKLFDEQVTVLLDRGA